MTEGIAGTIIAVLLLVCAYGMGEGVANSGWARDCDQLGARIHGEKVYDCKARSK